MNIDVLDGYRPLLVEGDTVYAWSNGALCISNDCGESFQRYKTLNNGVIGNISSRFELIERILRGGLHDLIHLDDGSFIAVARKGIIYAKEGEFTVTCKITRGTRPLSLCKYNGSVFFGEYFNNESRSHVDIFSSDNGIDWSVVYRFKPGLIRHVHSIVKDEYRGGLWVLTGDSDSESAIWFTDDNFKTLEPVLKNGQQARAVSVIPTKEGIIVPMDSPQQSNYISFYNIAVGRLEKVQHVESSIFFARQVGDLYVVSTAAEPSSVNNSNEAILYASQDGAVWREIFRSRKDIYSTISTRYFQYPTIAIPTVYGSRFLYCYCRSMRDYDNRMLRIHLDDILEEIKSASDHTFVCHESVKKSV